MFKNKKKINLQITIYIIIVIYTHEHRESRNHTTQTTKQNPERKKIIKHPITARSLIWYNKTPIHSRMKLNQLGP